LTFLGSLDGQTLLCRKNADLWILDRYQLERIRVRVRLEQGQVDAMPLLAPLILELPQGQCRRLLELSSSLLPMGLDVQDFGEGSMRVKSQPSVLAGTDLGALMGALSKLRRGEGEGARVLDLVLHTAAKAACHPLSTFELGERIQDLVELRPLALEEAGSCLSEAEIEARLRRFRAEED